MPKIKPSPWGIEKMRCVSGAHWCIAHLRLGTKNLRKLVTYLFTLLKMIFSQPRKGLFEVCKCLEQPSPVHGELNRIWVCVCMRIAAQRFLGIHLHLTYYLGTSAFGDMDTSASCVLQEIWLNNSDYVRVYGLNDYASCQTNCLQRTTAACVAWTFWTALLGISKKEGKYFF